MKKNLLLMLAILLTTLSFAQTTEEILHNRYWAYRERFNKMFIQLGESPGQGFPFSDLKRDWTSFAKKADANGDDVSPTVHHNFVGTLNVGGDVTAYMGDYMGILSSEYWLPKYHNKQNSSEFKAVNS